VVIWLAVGLLVLSMEINKYDLYCASLSPPCVYSSFKLVQGLKRSPPNRVAEVGAGGVVEARTFAMALVTYIM